LNFILIFFIVFLLNLLPAFAPPTWLVLSGLGVLEPELTPWRIALTAALAATLGRVVLAKAATVLVRQKWLTDRTRANIDVVKEKLAASPRMTVGVFLAYAFSPFSSNALFLAYGLTALPLVSVSLAFFIGRLATYTFWVVTASEVAHHVILDRAAVATYFGVYFVMTQIFLLGLVYLFAKFDWKAWFTTKRFRIMTRRGT
jgi:membrane protein YqaA with SNARE-associated domain